MPTPEEILKAEEYAKHDPSSTVLGPLALLFGSRMGGNIAQQEVGSRVGEYLENVPDALKVNPGDGERIARQMGGSHIPIARYSPLGPRFIGIPHSLGPEGVRFMDWVKSRVPMPEGVKIDFSQIPTAKETGYVHAPTGWGRDVLAHEYGHATGLAKHKAYRLGSLAAINLGRILAPVAGAYAGYSSDPDKTRLQAVGRGAALGAAGGLAANTPTLFEEGRASYRALRALRQSGVPWGDILKATGRVGSALGTYGFAGAALPAAFGAAAGLHGRNKAVNKRIEESKKLLRNQSALEKASAAFVLGKQFGRGK